MGFSGGGKGGGKGPAIAPRFAAAKGKGLVIGKGFSKGGKAPPAPKFEGFLDHSVIPYRGEPRRARTKSFQTQRVPDLTRGEAPRKATTATTTS